MQAQDQMVRFSQMQTAGVQLRLRFHALTSAHSYFQRNALKAISISDALDEGGIEAVFMDVRIRFQIMMIFNDAFQPRGKVVCTHCHSAYGLPVQENLGGFTFDTEGITDFETCLDGPALLLHENAPQIILTFLERAMAANRRL